MYKVLRKKKTAVLPRLDQKFLENVTKVRGRLKSDISHMNHTLSLCLDICRHTTPLTFNITQPMVMLNQLVVKLFSNAKPMSRYIAFAYLVRIL